MDELFDTFLGKLKKNIVTILFYENVFLQWALESKLFHRHAKRMFCRMETI